MSLHAQRRCAGAARRTGPQVQRATLAIPLPVQPTAAECGALIKTLVKHLLFQRAQIPYLYDELLKSVQDQQRAAEQVAAQEGNDRKRCRRRAPAADKRLLKFLAKAEELMAAIDTALRSFGVPDRCFLLLGSSTSKPREAYEILLPPGGVGPRVAAAPGAPPPPAAGPATAPQQQQGAAEAGAGAEPGAAPQQQLAGGRPKLSRQERLCLLAVRQLVVAGAELPEGTAHTAPCKLFLLLEGGSISSAGGGSSCSSCSIAGGAEQLQPAVSTPPGFAIKRQFKLSMRKGVHLKLLLGQHPQHGGEQQQQGQDMAAACDEDMSMLESQGEAAPTTDLSQLPDAASQPPLETAAAATAAADEQQQVQVQREPASGAGAAAVVASGRITAAGGTTGSLWYLCKAVVKGMNQHKQDDGSAEGFDGL